MVKGKLGWVSVAYSPYDLFETTLGYFVKLKKKFSRNLAHTTLMHVITILLIDDLDMADQPVFQVTNGIFQRLLSKSILLFKSY